MAVVETHAIRRVRALLDQSQAVVIAAPVGFAKTTTARAAVSSRENVVWYAAQAWERDAFAGALVDAVRTVRPDFGRFTQGLAEHGAEPGRLGTAFARDLTHVRDALTIVIDDAHHLWDGEQFAPFLDALLARVPPYVRFLIVSRTGAHLNLMDLVATDRAALVVAEELRFTPDEAAEFAREAGGGLNDGDAARIVEEFDGWPAGVALTFRFGSREMPSAIGSLDAVSAYLLDRLIATMSPGAIAVLEPACVFETIELSLFDETQRMPMREHLMDLEARGALVATVATGEHFRVHPLLRDAIRKRVQARGGSDAIGDLHVAASRAYARARRAGPALFHLAKADRDDAYLSFLRSSAEDAIASGQAGALRDVTARLRARGADDPVLDYVSGLIAKQRGGDGDLRAAFARSRDRANDRGDESLAYLSEAQLVEHDLARGRPLEAAAIAGLQARAAQRSPMEAALAAIRAGWYEAIGGRFARALDAVADVPDDGSSAAAFNTAPLRAYAHAALGEFETSAQLIAAMLDRLSNGETIVLYASGLIWASRLAMLRGDTNEAYDYAAEAQRVGEPFGLRHENAALYAALADAAVHAGDPKRAFEAARLARRFSSDAWYVRDAERAAGFSPLYEARAAFLSGDVERARTLSSEAAAKAATPLLRALARTDEFVFTSLLGSRGSAALRARLREEVASIEPADGADAVALQAAADLLVFFEALDGSGEPEPIVWAHPFAAMLERRASAAPLPAVGLALRGLRSGRSDAQGLIAGVRTLSAHGPRYEIAVVLSAARAHADVLRAPLERAVALYRGAVVLGGFTTPDSAAAKPELVEPLTPRESEILVLLAQGLTNKEMAQRLTLGSRTVETHVARILGKLGVNTRARAVARSLEMGLAAPIP